METGQTDTLIDPVALSALFDVKNRLINTALPQHPQGKRGLSLLGGDVAPPPEKPSFDSFSERNNFV